MSIAGNEYFTGIVNQPSTVADISVDRLTVSKLTAANQVTDDHTVGNLKVTGTSDLQGAVTVSNNLNVTGTSDLQGAVTVSNNLNVTGTSDLQGAVTVSNNLNIDGNLNVSNGNTNLENVTTTSILTVNGDLNVNNMPTTVPSNPGQLYRDSSGFVKVSI